MIAVGFAGEYATEPYTEPYTRRAGSKFFVEARARHSALAIERFDVPEALAEMRMLGAVAAFVTVGEAVVGALFENRGKRLPRMAIPDKNSVPNLAINGQAFFSRPEDKKRFAQFRPNLANGKPRTPFSWTDCTSPSGCRS